MYSRDSVIKQPDPEKALMHIEEDKELVQETV